MKRVLSIGQCGFDHAGISRLLSSEFGATVVAADTEEEAREELERAPCDLVLVNRLLDLDHSDGVALLRRLKADPEFQHVPMMLVSNYPDAQSRATAAGALPGFGKGDMSNPEVAARLARLLGGG